MKNLTVNQHLCNSTIYVIEKAIADIVCSYGDLIAKEASMRVSRLGMNLDASKISMDDFIDLATKQVASISVKVGNLNQLLSEYNKHVGVLTEVRLIPLDCVTNVGNALVDKDYSLFATQDDSEDAIKLKCIDFLHRYDKTIGQIANEISELVWFRKAAE